MKLAMMAAATVVLAGCVSVQSTEVAPPPKPRAPVRFVNPPQVAAPVGAYSQAAIVPEGARLIAVAGQVGLTPAGDLVEGAEAQYREALANVLRIVESQGGTRADIVKINIYLTQRLDPAKVRGMREEVLGDARPASTLVYVSGLARPEYLVEVEAWAVAPAR